MKSFWGFLTVGTIGCTLCFCLVFSIHKVKTAIPTDCPQYPSAALQLSEDGLYSDLTLGDHKYIALETKDYTEMRKEADENISRRLMERSRDQELQTIVRAMERGRKICSGHEYQHKWFADCWNKADDIEEGVAIPKPGAKRFPCEISVPVCSGQWLERK